MKKLVIFDLDGTLLNTIADLAQAVNYALKEMGLPTHSEKQYYHFVGHGINKLLERALPEQERKEETLRKARSFFMSYYDQHNTVFTRPYEGVETLLQQLQKQGIKLAIASNKYQQATEKLVRYYFPNISFVAVVGQKEGYPTKPNPLFIKEILEVCPMAKQDILYVGDSEVDIQTAQNSQIEVCAVTWGFRSVEELKPWLPTFWAKEAKDILKGLD